MLYVTWNKILVIKIAFITQSVYTLNKKKETPPRRKAEFKSGCFNYEGGFFNKKSLML